MGDNKQKKLIFSALPYVNNYPHLGNIVGCVLSSDVYARFCKKAGQHAFHVCGTDEYGTAIEMAAIEHKKHPQEICDMNHEVHKKIYNWFGIHFDYFGRTTEKSHAQNTIDFFMRMDKRGFLELQENQQLYCESCQIFLADRYVGGGCPQCGDRRARGDQCDTCGVTYAAVELVDPLCTLCRATPVLRNTTHIYFCLNLLKDQLAAFAKDKMAAWPHNAQEITREWLKKDLHPRCITRDLKFRWGVPVPKPGFEDKVLYVWFDAPIGYISFAKMLLRDKYDEFTKDCAIYQFMGKDNVSFHSIFFPAICLASETDFLVDMIASTEYLLFDSQKFSKSNKVGIFGIDLVDNEYGDASLWRFYLMKIRPETKDTNFTFQDFKLSVTGDLINNVGNLCNRVLKYVAKAGGRVQYTVSEKDEEFISKVDGLYLKYLAQMEKVELKHAVKTLLDTSTAGNEYIQSTMSMARDARDSSFCIAMSLVVYLGHMLEPFIPKVSQKIYEMAAAGGGAYPAKFELVECGHTIGSTIEPLFRPFTDAELAKMNK